LFSKTSNHRTGRDYDLRIGVRPQDLAGKTCRRLAAEQLSELVAEEKTNAFTKELKARDTAPGSTLMELPGVGPVVAARILR
jgi:transposase